MFRGDGSEMYYVGGARGSDVFGWGFWWLGQMSSALAVFVIFDGKNWISVEWKNPASGLDGRPYAR